MTNGFCPIDRISLLSEQYADITGATLDARIVAWMAAANYPMTATDRRILLEKLPVDAATILANMIEKAMESDEVRSALVAMQAESEIDYIFEESV